MCVYVRMYEYEYFLSSFLKRKGLIVVVVVVCRPTPWQHRSEEYEWSREKFRALLPGRRPGGHPDPDG